jgi:tRNA pseudouridine38-40 synthase
MRTLKLTIAYDGTAYAGWQSQLGKPTVQDTLENAIAKITGERLRVMASGRTDAGVHALAQVVGFRTNSALPPEVLVRALNATLPRDVAVLEAVEVPEGFHATHHTVRKRYRYVIYDGPIRDVFQRHFVWHYSYGRLDAAAMHRAAAALIGRHDFRSFQSSGSERKSSVRTISDLHVERGRAGEEENFITIEVEADGFLYNMVRAIVGTLVQVGRGEQPETWPGEVLRAADRGAAGPTAPPQGLCLVSVEYAMKSEKKDRDGSAATGPG